VFGGYAYSEVMDMTWPTFKLHLGALAGLESERLRSALIIARASQADEAGYKQVLALLNGGTRSQ